MTTKESYNNKWWLGPVVGLVVALSGSAISLGYAKAEIENLKQNLYKVEETAKRNSLVAIEVQIALAKQESTLIQIYESVKEIKEVLKEKNDDR